MDAASTSEPSELLRKRDSGFHLSAEEARRVALIELDAEADVNVTQAPVSKDNDAVTGTQDVYSSFSYLYSFLTQVRRNNRHIDSSTQPLSTNFSAQTPNHTQKVVKATSRNTAHSTRYPSQTLQHRSTRPHSTDICRTVSACRIHGIGESMPRWRIHDAGRWDADSLGRCCLCRYFLSDLGT
jgi:hypothetical protein